MDDIDEIITAVVLSSRISNEQLTWFENRGFVEDERFYQYILDVDVEETCKTKLEGKEADLTARVATEQDVDLLIELVMADDNLRQAFADEAEFRSYFVDRVFTVQSPVMLFDGDTIVAATAPLRYEADGTIASGEGEKIIMRFQAFRKGYQYAWKRLLVELAKLCKDVGWTDIPVQTGFGYSASGPQAAAIAKLQSELREYQIILVKRKE
jgi:hypothetical protein